MAGLRYLLALVVITLVGCPGSETPCGPAGECPFGATCVGQSCSPASCVLDTECPLGSLCKDEQCRPGCAGPIDCPVEAPHCSGEGGALGECRECLADEHCAGDEVCTDFVCVECAVDEDCPEFFHCAEGRCEVDDEVPLATAGVDILFVIDNSAGMNISQDALIAAMATDFIAALETAHGSRPDLHLGVISSDLGAGGVNLPGCTAPMMGELQNTPRGGCSEQPTTDRYLSEIGGTPNYTGTLDQAFACIADLGVAGCGFEQHLGSLRLALDPVTTVNDGFLRDDAALAIVILASEDDCTAHDPALFNPNNPAVGPMSSFRCFSQGVVCDPDEPDVRGDKTGCVPRADSTYVTDPAAIAAEIKTRRPPTRIAVAAITTNPSPVTVIDDPNNTANAALGPSCDLDPAPAIPQPAVRLHAFAAEFPQRNVTGNICEGPSAGLQAFAALIATMIE